MRILVADDHASVRRYICGVLEAEQGWSVCGEASNGREAVQMAAELKPDVVVLDLSMPVLNGLDAARQIRKELPRIAVVILTLHEGEELTRAVLETGAGACVVKTDLQRLVIELRTMLQSNAPQETRADEAFVV